MRSGERGPSQPMSDAGSVAGWLSHPFRREQRPAPVMGGQPPGYSFRRVGIVLVDVEQRGTAVAGNRCAALLVNRREPRFAHHALNRNDRADSRIAVVGRDENIGGFQSPVAFQPGQQFAEFRIRFPQSLAGPALSHAVLMLRLVRLG